MKNCHYIEIHGLLPGLRFNHYQNRLMRKNISVTVLFFHGDCNRNQNRKNVPPKLPVEFYIYTIVVKNIYVFSKI